MSDTVHCHRIRWVDDQNGWCNKSPIRVSVGYWPTAEAVAKAQSDYTFFIDVPQPCLTCGSELTRNDKGAWKCPKSELHDA